MGQIARKRDKPCNAVEVDLRLFSAILNVSCYDFLQDILHHPCPCPCPCLDEVLRASQYSRLSAPGATLAAETTQPYLEAIKAGTAIQVLWNVSQTAKPERRDNRATAGASCRPAG